MPPYFFLPPPDDALVPDDIPAGTFGAFSFFGFLTSLLLRACPLAMSVSCCDRRRGVILRLCAHLNAARDRKLLLPEHSVLRAQSP